jgi:hypothetical protein
MELIHSSVFKMSIAVALPIINRRKNLLEPYDLDRYTYNTLNLVRVFNESLSGH